MDYNADLEIDMTALDVECLEQSKLAFKYGKHLAHLKAVALRAEEKVKVIRSELVKEVTMDPDKYIGEGIKATGPNVEAYYRNHKKHKKAKKEWIQSQEDLAIAESANSEMSFSRKKMLSLLIELHGQQYFAGPSVPRNLPEEWKISQKKKEDREARMAKKLKRSKDD